MIYFKLIIQNKTCLTHHLAPRVVRGAMLVFLCSNIGRVNGEHNIVTLAGAQSSSENPFGMQKSLFI